MYFFFQFKPAVYCCLDECFRSSVGLLISDVLSSHIFKESRRRPVVTVLDKHACKNKPNDFSGPFIRGGIKKF